MYAAFCLIINTKTRCGERCRVSRFTFSVPCSTSEAHLKDAFLWSEFECYFMHCSFGDGLYYISAKSSIFCAHESCSVSLEVLYICYSGSRKLNSFAYFSTLFLFSWKWSLPHREQHHRSRSGNSHSYRWVLLLVPARLLRSACSFVFTCCSSSA